MGTEEADDALNEKYPYYIKLTYDSAGFLKNVSVKKVEGADSLLKRVQSVLTGYSLRNDFMDTMGIGAGASGNMVSAYYYDDSGLPASFQSIEEGSAPQIGLKIILTITTYCQYFWYWKLAMRKMSG